MLALLGIVHFAIGISTIVPGYLSIDEAIYHWMVKSFAEGGTLELWNGYEEFPSIELHHPFITPHDGRLFPPFPCVYPILAQPFSLAAGLPGLFFMNALAFVGIVALTFLIARKLFHDADLAANSCLILALATYAWDYSQALWPHALAVLFTVAAFFLFVCSWSASSKRSALGYALASGVVAGIGAGIRLDVLLVLPAILLPYLFVRPWRPVEALSVCVGALPGVALLSVTNFLKFGTFNPLDYGVQGVSPGMPGLSLSALVGGVVLSAWVATRSRYMGMVRDHKGIVAGLGVIVLAIWWLVLPDAGAQALQTLKGAYVSLVDIRALDPSIVWTPMSRSAGGGVVYIGGHKKALLQSLPFLTILVLPAVRMLRGGTEAVSIALVLLFPVTVLGYFSYNFVQGEGGGGLCLNHRYLLGCLPFLAILSAHAWRNLKERSRVRLPWTVWAMMCLATVGAFLAVTNRLGLTVDELELPLLTAPLAIAAGLLLVAVLVQIPRLASARAFSIGAALWFAVALAWAGAVGFCYDYPHHRNGRGIHRFYGEQALRAVSEDSILFVANRPFTASVKVIEREKVRIAIPARDGFKDFPGLLEYHLRAGRRAYGFFAPDTWEKLRTSLHPSHRVTPVTKLPGWTIAEISLRQ